MRLADALLHAMRTWRAGRSGQDEADRLVAGGRSGPGDAGLDHLLDALRAPATTGELRGEREMAAVLAAEHRSAALYERPKGRVRVQVPRATRTIVVSVATGLAVLSVGGTAVAAGTGALPAGLQQRAHRLFSALGVPAPRTGPTATGPTPGDRGSAASPTSKPTPTALPTPTPPATATVAPPTAQVVAWCTAWLTAENGGKPMNGRDRKDLAAAAGGTEEVADFCARSGVSVAPTTTPAKPGRGSTHRATPSHPGPKK